MTAMTATVSRLQLVDVDEPVFTGGVGNLPVVDSAGQATDLG
jgi:hypothetical protein